MHRLRLPIASPCSRSLEAMPDRGEGRRWCDDCEQHVHDLSSMRESEALALLGQRAGESICVAYRADHHSGELRFRDRPPRGLVVAIALVSGCLGLDAPELELPDEPEPPLWGNSSSGVLVESDEPELESEPELPEPESIEPGGLRLIVLFDGKPAAKVGIQLESASERWTGAADAEGRWSVGELPPGSYALQVQHDDRIASVRVDVLPGESSGAEVMFLPPPISDLRVLGAISIDMEDLSDSRRLPVHGSTARSF